MTTWKLQKLLYYSQAWHLAWEGGPLFSEPVEAWANGPVVYDVYYRHRGDFSVSRWPWGDPDALTGAQYDTVDRVLQAYGDLTGRQLSHLTHSENPWRDARGDLGPTERSRREIPQGAMLAYYEALDADPDVPTVDQIDWSGFE